MAVKGRSERLFIAVSPALRRSILMEGNPLQLVEGMLLAGYAIQASHGIIFLRGEYFLAHQRLQHAIDEARHLGWLGENILGTGFSFDIDRSSRTTRA